MLTEKQLKKQLLELSVFTLITVIVWISYEVYSALTKPSEAIVTKEELAKVPIDINMKELDKLRSRNVITEEMLVTLPANFTSFEVITEPAAPELVSTPSALEEINKEASPSVSVE